MEDRMDSKHAEIRKYFRALHKRKYLFIFFALFIMSVVAWGSYFLPKQYEAKSTVFIETNVIKNLVSGIAITPSMQDRIRVLSYAMLSRGLILQVLRDLDLDIEAEGNDKALENKIRDFQTKTKITVKGNDLFIVSLRNHDPKLAMNYVNTLVRRYIEENISAKREEAYGANRFLNEQIVLFKEKLDKADEKIINYRREKGVYMSVDETSLINEIKGYQGEIEKLNIRRNELLATKNKIQKQLAGEEPFTVAFARHVEGGQNDATITALENRINKLLVQYTENYPEIIKLRVEIEALKKQKAAAPQMDAIKKSDSATEPELSAMNPIFQELRQKLLQTETEIEALDAKRRQISTIINQKTNELRYIPVEKKQLSDLMREKDNYTQMYQQLLARAGQSEVSKQMEIEDKAATFRIVDPAVLSTKPVSPDRVKIILFGIVVGILGGFGGVILRESLDFSIKDVRALKNMGVEILAIIPKIGNEEERERERKKARLIYSIAGSYFFIICMTLLHEIMGFTYIDNLINRFMT
jgi:polysaccharide biosynthesis transport protein